MQTYTFRLTPGQDLFESLQAFVNEKHIEAGCVLCGVGSLAHATLRLADRAHHSEYDGHFEIVSLTGTLSVHGSHLHISIADGNGATLGGHLVPGCRVYTTGEIVLAHFPEEIYRRELSSDSGYEELVVYSRAQ
jgi:predicted DNA-binding protein with PD1-like motif